MREPLNTDELHAYILHQRRAKLVALILSIFILVLVYAITGFSPLYILLLIALAIALLMGVFQLRLTEREFILDWINTYRRQSQVSRKMLLLCSNLEKII